VAAIVREAGGLPGHGTSGDSSCACHNGGIRAGVGQGMCTPRVWWRRWGRGGLGSAPAKQLAVTSTGQEPAVPERQRLCRVMGWRRGLWQNSVVPAARVATTGPQEYSG